MANPFSLNGPALHWSHRIVRSSRDGSVHFFRLFLDPSSPSSPWFVLATIRSIARALDFAKSAAAATLSVTALGTTPSSPRALPFANAHHREMCMRTAIGTKKGQSRVASTGVLYGQTGHL